MANISLPSADRFAGLVCLILQIHPDWLDTSDHRAVYALVQYKTDQKIPAGSCSKEANLFHCFLKRLMKMY